MKRGQPVSVVLSGLMISVLLAGCVLLVPDGGNSQEPLLPADDAVADVEAIVAEAGVSVVAGVLLSVSADPMYENGLYEFLQVYTGTGNEIAVWSADSDGVSSEPESVRTFAGPGVPVDALDVEGMVASARELRETVDGCDEATVELSSVPSGAVARWASCSDGGLSQYVPGTATLDGEVVPDVFDPASAEGVASLVDVVRRVYGTTSVLDMVQGTPVLGAGENNVSILVTGMPIDDMECTPVLSVTSSFTDTGEVVVPVSPSCGVADYPPDSSLTAFDLASFDPAGLAGVWSAMNEAGFATEDMSGLHFFSSDGRMLIVRASPNDPGDEGWETTIAAS